METCCIICNKTGARVHTFSLIQNAVGGFWSFEAIPHGLAPPSSPTLFYFFTSAMKIYTYLALPVLVAAHNNRNHHARQLVATTTTTTSSAGSSISANVTSISPALSTVSFSLEATNPTAMPLASIVSGAASQPTQAISSTAVVGAIPTFIPGAPPLPNCESACLELANHLSFLLHATAALLNPANYPPLDKVPPTDSPEVKQWIAGLYSIFYLSLMDPSEQNFEDVASTGVVIPNISPTVAGGCPANPQAVADDANRCWWTCGGCTQKTDITTCVSLCLSSTPQHALTMNSARQAYLGLYV